MTGKLNATNNLSGLDHVVKRGLADPKRLGVTGGSHGGLMTSWLIGQGLKICCGRARRTGHQLGVGASDLEHPALLRSLGDRYTNPGGMYFERSPIMHAHKVKTPTLNICGTLDRCTPPKEAMQFHTALLENGVKSVLMTYPEEGHGVRKFPAAIDYVARMAGWF